MASLTKNGLRDWCCKDDNKTLYSYGFFVLQQ